MGIVSNGIARTGGTDVSSATAKAWDIKTGKTAYISSGSATGTGYFPGMVQFNGTTSYYSTTYTSSGNKIRGLFRVTNDGFTGDVVQYIGLVVKTHALLEVLVISDDYSTLPTQRGKVRVTARNSAGAIIYRAFSTAAITDGEPKTIYAAFDGDAGAATFYINGSNADDTGHADRTAPTTGSLDVGVTTAVYIGRSGAASGFWQGAIGPSGMDDSYGTNWSDFMQADGTPKDINETTWIEWSGGSVTSPLGRPLFWHESGLMTENKGSAGAMTANGTIILAAASTWS